MILTREQILAAKDGHTGGRGRPRQSETQREARQADVFKLVWTLLEREYRWGELSTLQRKAKAAQS